jgi:hypothetical protein
MHSPNEFAPLSVDDICDLRLALIERHGGDATGR